MFPAGTASCARTGIQALSAFVEVISPQQEWVCKDVRYSIKLISRGPRENIKKTETFTFSSAANDRGWHEFVKHEELSESSGLLDRDWKVHLVAWVDGLPDVDLPQPQADIDFSTELNPVQILVSDGPALIFDQRILVARSEYFQKMLTAEYKESSTRVVDLRQDAQASHKCVVALLSFLLTNSLDPHMDFDLATALWAMGDKFCLRGLKKAAEVLLVDMISEKTVLRMLTLVFDTDSDLEAMCWKLLQEERGLLHDQEDQLDALIQESPALAKRLILFRDKF
ncbi:unnamed protein product [Effrenium voratum]|nr:unnamed protein product [Effrenium voratum]